MEKRPGNPQHREQVDLRALVEYLLTAHGTCAFLLLGDVGALGQTFDGQKSKAQLPEKKSVETRTRAVGDQ
jgi:hypothetical protein